MSEYLLENGDNYPLSVEDNVALNAIMDDFNDKCDDIFTKSCDDQTKAYKDGEKKLLDSLDATLARFEVKVKGKISMTKQEAKDFIHDELEEFGLKVLLAKYQINSQTVFNLDSMQYYTISNFRVYIEEQKIMLREKFAQVYAIIEDARKEGL